MVDFLLPHLFLLLLLLLQLPLLSLLNALGSFFLLPFSLLDLLLPSLNALLSLPLALSLHLFLSLELVLDTGHPLNVVLQLAVLLEQDQLGEIVVFQLLFLLEQLVALVDLFGHFVLNFVNLFIHAFQCLKIIALSLLELIDLSVQQLQLLVQAWEVLGNLLLLALDFIELGLNLVSLVDVLERGLESLDVRDYLFLDVMIV